MHRTNPFSRFHSLHISSFLPHFFSLLLFLLQPPSFPCLSPFSEARRIAPLVWSIAVYWSLAVAWAFSWGFVLYSLVAAQNIPNAFGWVQVSSGKDILRKHASAKRTGKSWRSPGVKDEPVQTVEAHGSMAGSTTSSNSLWWELSVIQGSLTKRWSWRRRRWSHHKWPLCITFFSSRWWEPSEALQYQCDDAAELVAKMPERSQVACQGPGIGHGPGVQRTWLISEWNRRPIRLVADWLWDGGEKETSLGKHWISALSSYLLG